MEYYSSIQRNELQTCATTWMNFRLITLSERSQISGVHSMSSFRESYRKGKLIHSDRKQITGKRDSGQRQYKGTQETLLVGGGDK